MYLSLTLMLVCLSCCFSRSFLFFLYIKVVHFFFFFFSSRRRHTRCLSDWSSDVCSSDLGQSPQRRQMPLRQRAFARAAASSKAPAPPGLFDSHRLTAKSEDIAATTSQEEEIGRASCRERV